MRTRTAGTHERIFDAAARLFADQRFHEVRMDDLATEAGVSKGTLYRYFDDKEDLYRELVTTASKDILRGVEVLLAEAGNPQAKLEQVADSLFSYFDDRPYFFDLLQHVEALNYGAQEFPWAEDRKLLMAWVTELFAHEPLNVAQPQQCALILLGSIRALIRFGDRPRPERLAHSVVSTILHGAVRG